MSDPNLDMLPPALRMAAAARGSKTGTSSTQPKFRSKSFQVRKQEADALAKIRCQPRDDLVTEAEKRRTVVLRRQEEKKKRMKEDEERRAELQSQAIMDAMLNGGGGPSGGDGPPTLVVTDDDENDAKADQAAFHHLNMSWQRSSPVSLPPKSATTSAEAAALKNQLDSLPLEGDDEPASNSNNSKTSSSHNNNGKKDHSLEILKKKMEKVEKLLQATNVNTKEYKKLLKKKEQYEAEMREMPAITTHDEDVLEEEEAEKEEAEQKRRQRELEEEEEALKEKLRLERLEEYKRKQAERQKEEEAAKLREERSNQFKTLKKKLAKVESMIQDEQKKGDNNPTKLLKKKNEYLAQLDEFEEWQEEKEIRRKAEEEEERRQKAKEEAERIRKEQELARQARLEEERQRKAEEEAERRRKKAEQERREQEEAEERERQRKERLEAARKLQEEQERLEEQQRREEEEARQQRAREQAAEERRKQEEEEAAAEARRKQEEAEEQARRERQAAEEAQRKRELEEQQEEEDDDEEEEDEMTEEELRRIEEEELEHFLWQQQEAKRRAQEKKEREEAEAAEREAREAELAAQRAEEERLAAERKKQEAEKASSASQEFIDRRAIPEPHSANTKKILLELETIEKHHAKLEKTLKQNGIAISEDIPYELAKEKIAEIQEEMKELATSTEDQYIVQKKYYALEEDLSKYVTAMMLTDEFAEEQRLAEEQWEESIAADNLIAIRKIRSHMPVNIRNMTEEELTTQPTPNGKLLPAAFAKKFKRTNVLQLLRVNPDDLERMHPSLIESLRSTGLTLTERRALHAHLREIGTKWEELQQDPSIERKYSWFLALKAKFKEMVTAYDKHVKEYGPPGNHPYAKRNDPKGGGCPLLGNQCPVKADSAISYHEDYGFTQEAEYEKSEAAKTSPVDGGGSVPSRSKSGTFLTGNKSKTSSGKKAKDDQIMASIMARLNLAEPESAIDTKLIRELFHAQKRAVSLEKQLAQNNLAIPKDDISYEVAKEKVAEITEEIKVIAVKMGSTVDMKEMAVLEKDYSKLSDELEKYNNALMLTKEWALELVEKERKWEESVRPDNEEALRKIRRHMPVNIKDLSEQDMIEGVTPNGKQLPQKIVRKFKRTNILQLVRLPPSMIESMHPSSLESMRSTGLLLTERRALHEHLKELGDKWKAASNDKMSERKWMWHESLRGKFKELVTKYQEHVDQYGPPGNHPYAKRGEPGGGCPLIGKQCPLKADLEIDYSEDYGFPAEAVYNVEQVKKSNLLTVEDIERRKQEGDDWGYDANPQVEEPAPNRAPPVGIMASIASTGGSSSSKAPPKPGGGLMAAIAAKGGGGNDDDGNSAPAAPPKMGGGLLAAIASKKKSTNDNGDSNSPAPPPKMGGGLLAAIAAKGGGDSAPAAAEETTTSTAAAATSAPVSPTKQKRRMGGGILGAITQRGKKK